MDDGMLQAFVWILVMIFAGIVALFVTLWVMATLEERQRSKESSKGDSGSD